MYRLNVLLIFIRPCPVSGALRLLPEDSDSIIDIVNYKPSANDIHASKFCRVENVMGVITIIIGANLGCYPQNLKSAPN